MILVMSSLKHYYFNHEQMSKPKQARARVIQENG
jgi:hypothetical protein